MNHSRMVSSVVAGLIAILACSSNAQSSAKRNIILYVVDDQGTNDAGCYGNDVIRTPGLDELARHGMRMTHAFATTPSCSASRSVILSGKHNHANGQYGHEHSFHHFVSFPTLKTLPVRLSDAGYRTLSAGKYHVAPEPIYHFDEYVRRGSPIEMAEKTRSLIASESDQPFFLYFCTTEPHRPFRREGFQEVDPDDVIVPPYLPDTPECRRELARYYASVERADSGLKRLIEIVREAGHWEDTLILYLSDNGIAFPGAKTNVYEPGVRLPFVIRVPGQENVGNTIDAMITYADVAPTLLDYAGVDVESNAMHGRSFLPRMRGEEVGEWDEVYLSHTFHEITMYYPMRVVRERRYKLIWNIAHGLDFPFASDLFASETWQGVINSGATTYGKRSVDAYLQRPAFELYDLDTDPHEIHNRADDPEMRTELARLQAKLKAFQERTGDPWIVKWEHE